MGDMPARDAIDYAAMLAIVNAEDLIEAVREASPLAPEMGVIDLRPALGEEPGSAFGRPRGCPIWARQRSRRRPGWHPLHGGLHRPPTYRGGVR